MRGKPEGEANHANCVTTAHLAQRDPGAPIPGPRSRVGSGVSEFKHEEQNA